MALGGDVAPRSAMAAATSASGGEPLAGKSPSASPPLSHSSSSSSFSSSSSPSSSPSSSGQSPAHRWLTDQATCPCEKCGTSCNPLTTKGSAAAAPRAELCTAPSLGAAPAAAAGTADKAERGHRGQLEGEGGAGAGGRAGARAGWWGLGQWTDGSMTTLDMLTSPSIQVYLSIHVLASLTLVYIPCTPKLFLLAAASYVARMFGITAGYHRLLSHRILCGMPKGGPAAGEGWRAGFCAQGFGRCECVYVGRSFKTSRPMQLLLATLGCSAFQKGPLWWASHHRHHHRTADTKEDAHSPVIWGFFWSHMGWFLLSSRHTDVLWGSVPDLAIFPELRLLERFHWAPPLALGLGMLSVGGVPAVGWGFMVSTVACWHFTYCINSLAHVVGSRRFRCEFNTHCDARNNLWLALATLGEGWHNNHHCYMRSAKHGFYDHEIDITWYVISLAAQLGLVWDVELPPLKTLEAKRYDDRHLRCRCEYVESDMALCETASSKHGDTSRPSDAKKQNAIHE